MGPQLNPYLWNKIQTSSDGIRAPPHTHTCSTISHHFPFCFSLFYNTELPEVISWPSPFCNFLYLEGSSSILCLTERTGNHVLGFRTNAVFLSTPDKLRWSCSFVILHSLSSGVIYHTVSFYVVRQWFLDSIVHCCTLSTRHHVRTMVCVLLIFVQGWMDLQSDLDLITIK